MIMAYPSSFNFPDGHVPSSFAPSCHIFYKEAIIEVDDGVPKWSGHKDLSDPMPHSSGSHGKLGKGKSGQEKRGELSDEGNDEQSNGKRNEGFEHDDDYFYSSKPKDTEKAGGKEAQNGGGHYKKRKAD